MKELATSVSLLLTSGLCLCEIILCLMPLAYPPKVLWSLPLLCNLLVLQLYCCFSLSTVLGFYSLSYAIHICHAFWDSLSVLMHSGIACLTSQAHDWTTAFWDNLSGL